MALDPNWKDNPDIKKMFAGGLNAETTDEAFLEYFQKYGPIEKAEIVRDNNKGSRGFGFVSFENCDDLDRCLADRPHKIDNKEIDIKRAIPKNDTTQTATLRTKKLFVGGLREDCSQSGISEALESICGVKPSEVQLMKDKVSDKFRGFAFALFDNEDIVDKLFIIRNAVICSRKVDMKKAEERGKGGSVGGGYRGGRGGGRGRGGVGDMEEVAMGEGVVTLGPNRVMIMVALIMVVAMIMMVVMGQVIMVHTPEDTEVVLALIPIKAQILAPTQEVVEGVLDACEVVVVVVAATMLLINLVSFQASNSFLACAFLQIGLAV